MAATVASHTSEPVKRLCTLRTRPNRPETPAEVITSWRCSWRARRVAARPNPGRSRAATLRRVRAALACRRPPSLRPLPGGIGMVRMGSAGAAIAGFWGIVAASRWKGRSCRAASLRGCRCFLRFLENGVRRGAAEGRACIGALGVGGSGHGARGPPRDHRLRDRRPPLGRGWTRPAPVSETQDRRPDPARGRQVTPSRACCRTSPRAPGGTAPASSAVANTGGRAVPRAVPAVPAGRHLGLRPAGACLMPALLRTCR